MGLIDYFVPKIAQKRKLQQGKDNRYVKIQPHPIITCTVVNICGRGWIRNTSGGNSEFSVCPMKENISNIVVYVGLSFPFHWSSLTFHGHF